MVDKRFHSYLNGFSHNFENDVILDVWANHRKAWVNAKYVGVLSWRFKEKTGLTGGELIRRIKSCKEDAVAIIPKGYDVYEHPYTRKGYASVTTTAEYFDEIQAFPIQTG